MDQSPTEKFGLIKRFLPDWSPKLIFDVGAHRGESVKEMAKQFPSATIHSFEPSPNAYRKLVQVASAFPNVVSHNMALGKVIQTVRMTNRNDSSRNRLLSGDQDVPDSVEVQVKTGADVLRDFKEPTVDFLKIDTEGHDLDVLTGFLPVIDQIDFVQVEAGMNPYNTSHVPLRAFEDMLWERGFHLFHIFEQTMEWKKGGRPVLRRCNPVFINGRLLKLGKIS